MRSYLDLVKKYEKVHRKRNRITILCIVIAVSLVTAIFGMADMEARAQRIREMNEHGNWHFAIKNATGDQVEELLSKFSDKFEVSGYILGFDSKTTWQYGDTTFRITGGDGAMIEEFGLTMEQGEFPTNDTEIMIDDFTAKELQLKVGDTMRCMVREGETYDFTLCGTYANTAMMMESGMKGVVLHPSLASKLYDDSVYRKSYYVTLKNNQWYRKTIDAMKSELGFTEDEVSENTTLLALSGQSKDSYMIQLYGVAFGLFILVLIAGILMISGTFNTNVEERTQFFGMLRCLGATKKQIRRYVLYESLRYLRIALPIGVLLGTVTYWGACAYLKFVNYEFFSQMPMFGFSAVSLISGVAVGFFTVLFAALAPCKRASRVSPLSAVTANVYSVGLKIKNNAKTKVLHVENALGIHHATVNKKNLMLMTGSFGISIVLFLSFSVVIAFMNHALVAMEKWTPDVEYSSKGYSNTLPEESVDEILRVDGVLRAYGRKFTEGSLTIAGNEAPATLLTYEKNQFKWAKKYLIDGSIADIEDGAEKVIVAYNMSYPCKVGEKIPMTMNGVTREIEIGAIVNKTPFKVDNNEFVLITNEVYFDTFAETEGYAVIDVQLDRKKTDAAVDAIRKIAGTDVEYFGDVRMSNAQVKAANGSFAIFIYGFLAIIALITIFNIINSMNMSINARLGQLSVMHAVGMSIAQIKKMVMMEAVTYAGSGCLIGSVLGLLIHCKFYDMMVTFRWGTPWVLPWKELLVIGVIVIGSTLISVIGPMRKCKPFSIMNVT